MVNFQHIKELLNIDDMNECNNALRRSFAAFTEPLDVTGHENIALIILLNLTYPKKSVDDLLDKKLAKKTLNNEAHFNSCINEGQWLHTHNLKYPDIRVSKQRLISKPPMLQRSVLSSANCRRALGWSHDSAKVNVAKLLGSHFCWHGQELCLAVVLSESRKEWKLAFQDIGMPATAFLKLCERCKGFLSENLVPSVIDKYSPQVLMPYHDGYLAITPVTSHVLQSKIQQVALKKEGRYTIIDHTRSAAVSELSASLGGKVRAFNYPPNVNNSMHGLSQSRLFQMKMGQSVLNHKVLTQPDFVKALDALLFNRLELALKQRRQLKVASHKCIRTKLCEWIAPVLEWRLEIEESDCPFNQFENGYGTLEFQLLTHPNEQLMDSVSPLFSLLNTVLSNSPRTSKYAFHQKLMIPLKNHVKWLLENFTKPEAPKVSDGDDEIKQRYLYLRGIRVYDAQALSNPYCSGVPSLTAVWGMLHNYQRKLNEQLDVRVRFTSFSWFVRQFSYVPGKKLPEFGMQGVNENQFRRSGIIDNRYCDLEFDLVVHLTGYDEDLHKIDKHNDILKATFPARFAGGVMHPPLINFANVNEWCCLYYDELTLYTKLRRLPMYGKWIMPTRYAIHDLDELILLLKNNSALCPTMFGYLLLDRPKKRANSLEPLHSYAEPAIGVIECTTAIEIRLQGMSNYFRRAFWMLDAQEYFMLMKRI